MDREITYQLMRGYSAALIMKKMPIKIIKRNYILSIMQKYDENET